MAGRDTALIAGKIAKSEEFLLMSSLAYDEGCWDSCVSLAVSAGVNASDVIVYHRVGRIVAGQNHEEASRVLRKNSEADAANLLARLLPLKHKAQYSGNRCTRSDADSAYKRADRLLQSAKSRAND